MQFAELVLLDEVANGSVIQSEHGFDFVNSIKHLSHFQVPIRRAKEQADHGLSECHRTLILYPGICQKQAYLVAGRSAGAGFGSAGITAPGASDGGGVLEAASIKLRTSWGEGLPELKSSSCLS